MPTRSRPPAPGAPRKTAGKSAGSTKARPPSATRPAKTARAPGTKGAPRPPAVPAEPARPAAAGRPAPAEPARPKVQRTCYEVRLMVCPRNPATCPETWPMGQRVLCGSFQMLARFEKESGGEDLGLAEAGLADALSGLSIRNQPDADPDEREDDGDDGGPDEDEV